MLPSLQLLEKVSGEIMSVPNRRKENKRGVHYGLFLLGYKSGLRISEAVRFDLENKTKSGLYRIEKPKGRKERFVYIPKKVIGELKKNNWQPQQTNRWNFYHFLRKIKRELGISANVELTPHTLRRSFTTYHAESGLPLPLLQKLLGHSSIRTTALYWRNIHQEPNNDIGDILTGKKWLEKPKASQTKEPSKPPITENFPEIPKNPKSIFTANKSKPTKRPIIKKTPLLFIKKSLAIEPKPHEQKILTKITDQKSINSKQLTLITNQGEQSTEKKSFIGDQKEAILLTKIKSLEEQLKQTQTERDNLKIEKEQEKQRADYYQQQLKTIAKTLYQWQKINHYQQLEREQNPVQRAQIIQPPPLKIK